MRKNYLIACLASLIIVGTIVTWKSPQAEKKGKKVLTSELLIQNQINEKIERRKNGYAKQDRPDKFLEYIHMLKTGGIEGNNYKTNNALTELNKAKLALPKLKSAKALNWIQRGPGNVGGRTRGLVIDPDDASGNTWYTGPVGGGVWKTTDGGNNWTSLTLDWPNLSVSALAMAESNHDVMYAGTGEGFGNLDAIKGNGVFKTVDRGNSWTQLQSTATTENFSYVNRLIIDPSNADIVIAVTNAGIYKTIDGGLNWERRYIGSGRIQDIIMKPGDFKILFASENNQGILASVDGGENWKLIKEIKQGRIELTSSKNFPEQIYALTSQSNLFYTYDGGDNWEVTYPGTKVTFLSGQGWYNNTMVAHPTNENILFVGGVDQYKVTLTHEDKDEGPQVFDLTLSNTDFLSWKDMDGQYLAGGVKMIAANSGLFTDIEITFGNDVSQMAHRFTQSAEDEAVYHEYVSVPFKVMDMTNSKQLMVSFVDENEDGKFNLGTSTKEQIYIHVVDYSVTASSDIIGESGINHNNVLVMNPVLASGYEWTPDNLPEATILLDAYRLKKTKISSTQQTVWHSPTASNYSHADHHNLMVVEGVGDPFRIVNCNDGGVFISDDGGVNWQERISGYVTTQFYGISRHPEKNIYLAGTQDNGTWFSPENPNKVSSWKRAWGGDGFETAWSAADPNKMAMSIYNNEIKITYDGGETWSTANIGDTGENAPFVTRIANEASNPDLMFVGGQTGVWRSIDFGKNWDLISMPAGSWNYGGNYPHIAISPINSKYVWAGNAISLDNDLALSSNGGKTFVKVSKPAGVGSVISEIIAHPTDENAVFVLFAKNRHPKILYSDDLGESWIDLSQFNNGSSENGFPNVAVYSLAVMPYNTDIIWAGTEIGIFESIDGGESWHFADNGLPAVCIWDMKIVGQQLVVATHGLGVWTLDIPEIVEDKKPLIKSAAKTPSSTFKYNFEVFKDYDRIELFIDEKLVETIEDVTAGSQNIEIEHNSLKAEFSSYLNCFNGDEFDVSNYIWVKNPQYEDPVERYMNSFAERRYDFIGEGFKITNTLFSDWAIQNETHPYEKKKDIIYSLKIPITIKEDENESIMSYRDIALVEAGESGARFGTEGFYDYVVVEATKDGINWIPLADGYDVTKVEAWKDFADADNDYKNIESKPDSRDLFVEHTINLQDQFDAGDVILIRFRLHSDPESVGWGWIIDDIIIQESGTSTGEDISLDQQLTVSPNPATSYFDVKLESEDVGEVTATLYDV
ncbi:MAG: hypothetical protein N4A74_08460, partial [Carboxylicivirga sp.]|nr:hypothetical protein [Carboxylicivirga sp.]